MHEAGTGLVSAYKEDEDMVFAFKHTSVFMEQTVGWTHEQIARFSCSFW